MIQPFKDLLKPLGAKGVASVAYVERRLKEILMPLKFEGHGLTITEQNDSTVHFKVKGAGDNSTIFPFQVTGGGGTFSISPGTVMTDSGTGESLFFTPIGPNGLPLDATFGSPGVFATGAGATGYVCLRVNYSSAGGAINYPWSIVFSPDGMLANQPLRRMNGYNGEGQNALIDLPLARIVLGEVKSQCIGCMITVRFRYNEFEPGAMPVGGWLT